ncbi:MAG: hypothetical protein IID16_05280 [Candidatus Marinimicrobia bacterium]|nr:hypothetical protein [Candidatus Neomarinimicrobiota bacterium]
MEYGIRYIGEVVENEKVIENISEGSCGGVSIIMYIRRLSTGYPKDPVDWALDLGFCLPVSRQGSLQVFPYLK